MRKIAVLVLLTFWVIPAIAQKKYVDPNERQKRGLLEEGQKEEVVSSVKEEAQTNAEKVFTPQEQFCECKVLESLNQGMDGLYWSSKADERAMTSPEEIVARRENVEETLVALVKKYSKSDTPINPKKCPSTRFSAPSVAKMEELIVKQEKRCDVFKLRGADNE